MTEQQVLTPRQLAGQVKRLTATPAEWVARVRLDARKPKVEQVAANLIDLAWNGLSQLDARA